MKRLTHRQIVEKCARAGSDANYTHDGALHWDSYDCVKEAHRRAASVIIRKYCREMIRAGLKFRVR
jgi:hypothetical protein